MTIPADECWISVDLECSGLRAAVHSVLSIGAVVVGDSGRRFYTELRPTTEEFMEESVRIGWPGIPARETLAKLTAEAPSAPDALDALTDWVERTAVGRTPVFCARPLGFDWSFLVEAYLREHRLPPFPWGRTLDIDSFWAGVNGGDRTLPPAMLEGLPPHTHNALDDAVEQGVLLERMLANAADR